LKREAEAQNATLRARRILQWGGATAALLVVMAALGFAAYQQRNAKMQAELKSVAERERAEAVRQKGEAEREATGAQRNLRRGQITESRFRAEQAKLAGEDHVTAILLALEGLPDKAGEVERPFLNEPWHALYGAHVKQRERVVLVGHKGSVGGAVFSADGRR